MMANEIQNEIVVCTERDSTSGNINISTQNNFKDARFKDMNGSVNYSDCDILPNNNVRNNIDLSQCKSDKECVTSTVENEPTLNKDICTSAYIESASGDLQIQTNLQDTDYYETGR